MIQHILVITVIAFAAVAVAVLLGASEHAGLLGAIIGVGAYVATNGDDKIE